MQTSTLSIQTADGVADARLFQPDGAGPWPAVLFFTDAFGLTPGAVQMAERLASNGYAVLLPNLFYRAGAYAPFNMATVWTDPPERTRLMSIVGPGAAGAVKDTPTYLATLAKQPGVRVDRVGAVGYCMGGRVALVDAETYPDRFAAIACIHGGGLVTDAPESPHKHVDKVKARVYFAIADQDAGCTPEHQAQLEASLKAAGVRYQQEFYPDARHGFAVVGTPVFDAVAAEKHWDRVLTLFKETLV
jgi:carboxymethylenebutenolidase